MTRKRPQARQEVQEKVQTSEVPGAARERLWVTSSGPGLGEEGGALCPSGVAHMPWPDCLTAWALAPAACPAVTRLCFLSKCHSAFRSFPCFWSPPEASLLPTPPPVPQDLPLWASCSLSLLLSPPSLPLALTVPNSSPPRAQNPKPQVLRLLLPAASQTNLHPAPSSPALLSLGARGCAAVHCDACPRAPAIGGRHPWPPV